MPKHEPRFALSRILQAMVSAGLTDQQGKGVIEQLQRLKFRRGRHPENDGADIKRVLSLAGWDEENMTFNAAARTVAADYPESQREAVRKRLARKIKAYAKERKQELKEATEGLFARSWEQAQELERLRQRVAELEKPRSKVSLVDALRRARSGRSPKKPP